jgi:hypothetical protein
MLRLLAGILIAAVLSLPVAADPASGHPRRHGKPIWHGYGFLPGYRTPEQIARESPRPRTGVYFPGFPGYNFYGGPGFYQHRWNGGGFGPCWTRTPVGPHWNCG